MHLRKADTNCPRRFSSVLLVLCSSRRLRARKAVIHPGFHTMQCVFPKEGVLGRHGIENVNAHVPLQQSCLQIPVKARQPGMSCCHACYSSTQVLPTMPTIASKTNNKQNYTKSAPRHAVRFAMVLGGS
eukprot:5600789-Amphidinium_carterae.1